jgi:cysteine desulfurase family protein (TIGR01976 family)
MPLDVAAIRAHFPALREGAAHFDGAGGTQTPDVVADAIRAALVAPMANRGLVTVAELNAERSVHAARAAMADLLGADPQGIIFGRSMTALTFDFARTLAKDWRPGDEVVVSRLDHDANVRPWVLAAEQAGATLRWVDFDPDTAELDDVAGSLSERTRLVAITGASNLLGTRPDLPRIAAQVHEVGGLFYVDGVHLSAHAAIDVAALGADLYACSPYKFFGPHCGVVAGSVALLERLRPDKLLPAADAVPERFEHGTLPYELLAGTSAAVAFLATLAPTAGTRRERLTAAMTLVEEHEDRLRRSIEDGVAAIGGITGHSRARRRTPTLLFTFADGRPVADAYEFLAEQGVNAPAGSFYAYEPAKRLGLGPAGGLRVGLSPFTDDEDVARLLDGLAKFVG